MWQGARPCEAWQVQRESLVLPLHWWDGLWFLCIAGWARCVSWTFLASASSSAIRTRCCLVRLEALGVFKEEAPTLESQHGLGPGRVSAAKLARMQYQERLEAKARVGRKTPTSSEGSSSWLTCEGRGWPWRSARLCRELTLLQRSAPLWAPQGGWLGGFRARNIFTGSGLEGRAPGRCSMPFEYRFARKAPAPSRSETLPATCPDIWQRRGQFS